MIEPASESLMYRWRNLTEEQREEVLDQRRREGLPWHSPPHYANESGLYLISAACYEHRPIIGRDVSRMADFEAELLQTTGGQAEETFAWVALPNHYHVLLHAKNVKGLLKGLLKGLGRLHGRTSHRWNGEEGTRGRKVWCNAAETAMKSEGLFWASVNYGLHNPVRHGYVERWQDWPFSSPRQYLAGIGHEEVLRRWKAYPILDYGAEWDPPEL